jgi:hypothetical protein
MSVLAVVVALYAAAELAIMEPTKREAFIVNR